MEHAYYTVKTAEETLDSELFDMYRGERGVYIGSSECNEGRLYWGGGRSIGQLAVCRGVDKYKRMQFEGLRSKFGVDYLFTEYHYDDDPSFGTYTPLVELDALPEDLTAEEETMYWILEITIELLETRVEWLKYLPSRLKAAPSYGWLVEHEQEYLEEKLRLRTEGFSDTPEPTFREIMEARQKEASKTTDSVV